MARGQIGGDLQAFRGGGGQQRQAHVDNKAYRINAGGNGPKTLLEGLIEAEKKNILRDFVTSLTSCFSQHSRRASGARVYSEPSRA